MAPCDACKLSCCGRFCNDDGDDNGDDDDDDNIDDGVYICKSRVWAIPAGGWGLQREIQIGV